MKRPFKKARGVLWQAVQFHPASAAIIYNLSCYACVLGEVEKAKGLLTTAFAIDSDFRLVALDDPDLEALFRRESAG